LEKIKEKKFKKILIMGVGNILLKDEGFGIHIVRELEKLELPENVELLDGGVLGPNLLGYIEDIEKLIVVDIINAKMKPGKILKIKPEQIKNKSQKYFFSFHQIGLLEALNMAEILGRKFETIIFAIQPKSIEMGMELSEELKEKIPEMINLILDEIKN
jgi:hydrogenase maturation protease